MPSSWRLRALPPPTRLAVALFVVFVLGLHVTAQGTLWVTSGEGSLPGPSDILGKYHGRRDRSLLHDVLDLRRPAGDPRAMYWYLDPTSTPDNLELVKQRRKKILDWVERGAPKAGWPEVRSILQNQGICMQCHGFGGQRFALTPLETYAEVKRVAAPGQGIPIGSLLTSAHNHVFAFGTLALLLSLGLALTGLSRGMARALVLAVFLGALMDVGGWFLTRALGAPFQYVVLLGGAAFGAGTTCMGLLVLDEAATGGAVLRLLRRWVPRRRAPPPAGEVP